MLRYYNETNTKVILFVTVDVFHICSTDITEFRIRNNVPHSYGEKYFVYEFYEESVNQ